MHNQQITFVKRPSGKFDPSETFRTTSAAVPTPSNGQVLVRSIYLSLDPAMRGWMNDARSYVKPLAIGEIMRGLVVGQIAATASQRFQVGQYVLAAIGWQQYGLMDERDVVPLPSDAPIQHTHALLGTTALTAYFGFFDVGRPIAGETVVVSGAAGATGSIVCQLAKLNGCRVVGIAGGKAKCQSLVDELGVDVALDYRAPDFVDQLKQATPQFIDVYFDNVGGDILDACLNRLAFKGRVVLCGAISQYNVKKPVGPRAYLNLIGQRGKMEGFIVMDYAMHFPKARQHLVQWWRQGKLRVWDETVEGGLQVAPATLSKLFDGRSGKGKLQVKDSQDGIGQSDSESHVDTDFTDTDVHCASTPPVSKLLRKRKLKSVEGAEKSASNEPATIPSTYIPELGTGAIIDKILNINDQLIQVCLEYQNRGWIQDPEYAVYQKRLQTNLLYLAAVGNHYLLPQQDPSSTPHIAIPDLTPVPRIVPNTSGLCIHVDQSIARYQSQIQEHTPQMVTRSRAAFQALHAEQSTRLNLSSLPEAERKRVRAQFVTPVRVLVSNGMSMEGDKLEHVQKWQPVPPFVSGTGKHIRGVASGEELKAKAEQEAVALSRGWGSLNRQEDKEEQEKEHHHQSA